ncbi:MAG: hypothetical protein ACREQN_08150, partial [Candidatus Binataceae bacterium]
GNNYWISYPTIALDSDLDIYLGSTWFTAGIYPSTVWDMYHGLNPLLFEGQNNIEQSSGEYTGNPNDSPQRWGDYNTMAFDPNATGPSKEGSFWQIEEISKGGADESTMWAALADPLPFFVGSNFAESECSAGIGYNCTVTINAPSNVQNGDVLLVSLGMGESAGSHLPKLPAGWSLLPASNLSGAQRIFSHDSCSRYFASWLVAHVYGSTSGDPAAISSPTSILATPIAATA